MWKVPLFELNYDSAESKAVQEVLDSQWLTMGEKTIAFEQQFANLLNDANVKCTLVSNCTAALYMALLALDLKSDDEVIIPSLTFVADLNATLMAGAKPVLADCESFDYWNISARTIRPLITPKTKAVMVVHFAGYPCEMDEIVALCQQHNLVLIEDVAHAPGATYKGKACGTFGEIGCFSFFSNKNLSMGEGGLISTRSEEMYQRIRHIRSHGMSTLTFDRHKGRAISYDVIRTGLNFRSDEIHAALGLAQLDKLSKANQQRAEISAYYREQLKSISEISVPFDHIGECQPVYHVFPILINTKIDRIKVITSLKEDGIQSSIHYPSFHDFSGFKHLSLNSTPTASEISERELTLPLFPTMTREQVDLVVNSLKNAIKKSMQ
jgi:dTDP-4-amino-4,6-dideoxygalactose transaminase